jgi:sarcosine oxidase subunit beta
MRLAMRPYSIFTLARNALTGHERWREAWRSPEPKPAYDVVIVGAGGHGLATAYYLAKEHGISNVAVLEKGWLGGGNTGRNTTVIRSNYLFDESAFLYDHALKLWEGMSRELNFNVMFSQRGVMNLAHDHHEARDLKRRIHANRLNGVDAEWLTREEVFDFCPVLNRDPNIRFPIIGATLQRRGGTARHDAVAWGYARAADARGVDIIQNCEVTGLDVKDGRIAGLQTSRGAIRAVKVGIVAAGHSSVLAAMAGIRLPLESHPLQALVSEPIKPVLHSVVMSNAVHAYCSQSDKGELVIGAGIDAHVSYSQRGSFQIIEENIAAVVEMFPIFSRLRMLRQWGGIVDVAPDASPIISKTPVAGLYLNCGWGTGGFKATPGSGTSSPTPSPATSPTSSTPPTPSTASPAASSSPSTARRPSPTERRGHALFLIACPWCGPREQREFRCGGQAHIVRPARPADLGDEAWADFLFMRDNVKGIHAERWVHIHGCRRWFNVLRNTATDTILAVYEMGQARPAPPAPDAAAIPATPCGEPAVGSGNRALDAAPP